MADSHSLTFTNAKTYVKTYSYNSGTSYSVDYTQSFGNKYEVKTSSLDNKTTTKILYIPPSGVPSVMLQDTTVLSALTLNISIKASSGNTDTEYYRIYAATSEVTGTAKQIFEALAGMASYSNSLESFKPSLSGSTLVKVSDYSAVTDQTLIRNALKYGVFIYYDTYETETYQSYFSASSISFEVKYYTSDSPPDVSLTSPLHDDFLAYVSVTDPFKVTWDYIQPAGTSQSGFKLLYVYSPLEGAGDPQTFIDLVVSDQHAYTIQPSEWILPRGYTDRIVFWVKAYTKNNTVSSPVTTELNEDSAAFDLYFPHPYELSPGGNSVILSADVTRLSWKIKFDCEEEGFSVTNEPTNFDIEYSTNGGESWKKLLDNGVVSRDGALYFYDVPANTFPSGVIQWRVRAYAGGKTIGTYEREAITASVQASTFSVTCDGKSLPTISWTSSAQIAYQIRFADYDSGARYGSETSFTVPYFYADGYYPVQVRTQASDGTWSAWTEMQYVQITNTVQANSITLTAGHTRHAVVLQWIDSGTSENYVVYRDHMPVYIGTDTSFTDIAANGKCTYYVRAIQPSRNYSQSNTVTLDVYPKTDCVYDFSSMQWIPLKYSLQDRSRNYSKSADVIYMNYAGRDKPVAFLSGHTVRQMSGSYVFKTEEEALRIQNAAGKTVIFKDTRGGKIIGILNNANITVLKKLYAVTFIVTETDYIEEKEYAAE